jgi:hypothetical protein
VRERPRGVRQLWELTWQVWLSLLMTRGAHLKQVKLGVCVRSESRHLQLLGMLRIWLLPVVVTSTLHLDAANIGPSCLLRDHVCGWNNNPMDGILLLDILQSVIQLQRKHASCARRCLHLSYSCRPVWSSMRIL